MKGQDPLSNRACRFPAHGLPMVVGMSHAWRVDHRRGDPSGCQPAHATAGNPTTWRASLAWAEVVVRLQRASARRGSWDRSCRPCPDTYPRCKRDQSRDPSLPPCSSSRRSAVLRSPRTPAAHHSISPSAYTRGGTLTGAAQTGLSCSVPLRAHVLRPIPRRDLRCDLRTVTPQTWPSPRRDRLGSRVVNVTRLQASLEVAARVLASSAEALDTPLEPPTSRSEFGVCYSALRCLPRRDLHPLETNGRK